MDIYYPIPIRITELLFSFLLKKYIFSFTILDFKIYDEIAEIVEWKGNCRYYINLILFLFCGWQQLNEMTYLVTKN
jgi:hypothetical protein